jgi:hypothetical protein
MGIRTLGFAREEEGAREVFADPRNDPTSCFCLLTITMALYFSSSQLHCVRDPFSSSALGLVDGKSGTRSVQRCDIDEAKPEVTLIIIIFSKQLCCCLNKIANSFSD